MDCRKFAVICLPELARCIHEAQHNHNWNRSGPVMELVVAQRDLLDDAGAVAVARGDLRGGGDGVSLRDELGPARTSFAAKSSWGNSIKIYR